MNNNNRLKIPIINIIAYENSCPGVNTYVCTQCDEVAFTNVKHLKDHELRSHNKTFPGCVMSEFISFLSKKEFYWDQCSLNGQHQCYYNNSGLYLCYCPNC